MANDRRRRLLDHVGGHAAHALRPHRMGDGAQLQGAAARGGRGGREGSARRCRHPRQPTAQCEAGRLEANRRGRPPWKDPPSPAPGRLVPVSPRTSEGRRRDARRRPHGGDARVGARRRVRTWRRRWLPRVRGAHGGQHRRGAQEGAPRGPRRVSGEVRRGRSRERESKWPTRRRRAKSAPRCSRRR